MAERDLLRLGKGGGICRHRCEFRDWGKNSLKIRRRVCVLRGGGAWWRGLREPQTGDGERAGSWQTVAYHRGASSKEGLRRTREKKNGQNKGSKGGQKGKRWDFAWWGKRRAIT